MDIQSARQSIRSTWEDSITPDLHDYIRIPNQSPAFDGVWQAHGHMDRAVALAREWIEPQRVPDLTVEIVRVDGRTPVLLVEIAGSSDDTVLLYGHLDKQPPMHGWSDGLGQQSDFKNHELAESARHAVRRGSCQDFFAQLVKRDEFCMVSLHGNVGNAAIRGESFAAASCVRVTAVAWSLLLLCALAPAHAGIPDGACCLPDATCTVLTEMQCEQADGTLVGLGVSCEVVSCEMASVPMFSVAFLAVVATNLAAAGIFQLQRRRAG